jgi:hypothetical protein
VTGSDHPRFHSALGGLWTDLSNAHAVVDGQLAIGLVTPVEADRLRHWIDHGFVIIEKAVPATLVDAVLEDLDACLTGRLPPRIAEFWDDRGKRFERGSAERMQGEGSKLLDLYVSSERCREMLFCPEILRFLQLVFQRPPLAFQSLTFVRGTRQPVHRDTAFVPVTSPLEMVASWVALEDVAAGSGELEYYPGSHRMPDELFEGGLKRVPDGTRVGRDYSEGLHRRAREAGLSLDRFLPSKGDVLFWAADLIHGGRDQVDPGRTRRSHVTHYCPVDQEPLYLRHAPDPSRHPAGEGGWYCSGPDPA